MAGAEGKRVKKVEGIPIESAEKLGDIEKGVEEKEEKKQEKRDDKEKGVGGLT